MRLYNIVVINERTGKQVMTEQDVKMIILLDNVLADIMADLDKDISSHSAMILSEESRFISEQIRRLRGKQNA